MTEEGPAQSATSSQQRYQRLVDLASRCRRNCQRLRAMSKSTAPPPGLDALLRDLRRDVAEGLPLLDEFQEELDAAAKLQGLPDGAFGAHPLEADVRIARAMLRTIDEAD